MAEKQTQKFLFHVFQKTDRLIVEKNADPSKGEVNLVWADTLLNGNPRDYRLVERDVEEAPHPKEPKKTAVQPEQSEQVSPEKTAEQEVVCKLTALKEKADSLGIKYRSNITEKTLEKKIQELSLIHI